MIRNRQLLLDYKVTFESPEGQRVLQDLRKLCIAFDRPVVCDDPIVLSRLMGEANVVKHIFQKLHKDPNELTETPKAINITSVTGESV